nr:uncharacterized protein LOC124806808 [Hydra vulgaris]
MFSSTICHLPTPHYQLSSVNFISYCVGFFLAGHAPQDGRGKHNNRPHKLTDKTLVCGHISSFRGRHSHYAMGETRKLYLPDTLNVAKMHQMFVSVHPETKISYESYRTLFNTKFNIGFGYPRKDTCSTYDEFIVKLQHVDGDIADAESNGRDVAGLNSKKTELLTNHELHKRKASTFYARKAAAKERARKCDKFEAICFDFAKNLPVPNKSTNDVYYRRQLSLYTFVIHVLSTDEVYMYTYDETVAKKGADDVCSFLADFIRSHISEAVDEISFFCDGCSGQNKNYTMIRFLYNQVHERKRFKLVKITFPIRGHSYMECDRDFSNVNMTKNVDLPEDWLAEFATARSRPTPFTVIRATQDMFFAYTKYFRPFFKAVCPIKTRPVREIHILDSRPLLVLYRDSWNGGFVSAVLKKTRTRRGKKQPQMSVLTKLYENGPLPISSEKYKDLQVLKRFCSPTNHQFFDELPHNGSDTARVNPGHELSDLSENED